ncbi:unnamed protein product [Nezara viridula]|uniref:Uncharacterized protein n=1 Tax=Nezara viridula TaxID=85310 RepID=A0A9P0ME99_NEZVI|nr:unnamed protein product [Nezara viridula]
MDAESLRKIITSQSEKRRIEKKGYKEGPVKRIVRIMDEPVFILRRLVLYIGDQRCAVTLLSLNLKLEGNLALEYYLNELMRTLQGPGKPRLRKRVKSPIKYSRVVTTESDIEEGGKAREEERMEVDITESDLEEAFARAVNIEGSEKGEDEETIIEKETENSATEATLSQPGSSAVDKLESLLSELIEQELSSTCEVKQEREDEDEYLVQK